MATILLVDDRRDAELVVGQQLKQRGFSVRTLNESTQLRETLLGGGIDAILMDMNMPEMDGCEATEIVKADETLRHIPIVIYTSHPIPGDEDRALNSGCDGFIAKPVDMDNFQSILELYFSARVREPVAADTILQKKIPVPPHQ